MKQLIPLLAASFVSLAALMVLLAFVWPQFFYIVPGIAPPLTSTHADTLAAEVRSGVDSVTASADVTPGDTLMAPMSSKDTVQVTATSSAHLPVDSVRKQTSAEDSLRALVKTLQEIRDRFNKPAYVLSDSLTEAEVRTMAQIFEAMDPESAARIINNMDDHAARQVLTTMKKRQSAKILAAINPQQAARILKMKGDL
ncbi:MAG TPA: hypothetical protein VNL69_01380 [Bacteroidota bacterium]|nr:hypothetical protein [Bacteroidota bacterium]